MGGVALRVSPHVPGLLLFGLDAHAFEATPHPPEETVPTYVECSDACIWLQGIIYVRAYSETKNNWKPTKVESQKMLKPKHAKTRIC